MSDNIRNKKRPIKFGLFINGGAFGTTVELFLHFIITIIKVADYL